MFETAELDHKVSKDEYSDEVPELRRALLEAQIELGEQPAFPVLILIAGLEGAGKSETVHLLTEWMDPRFIEVNGFLFPTPEEQSHPRMWRFWRALPPKGRIGVFFGAWQTVPIIERLTGQLSDADFSARVQEIVRLEQMLVDEGVLLLKYWFHLSKRQQEDRIRTLEKSKAESWKISDLQSALYEHYDEFMAVSKPFLRQTSTAAAPWTIVPSSDERYRALFVGRDLRSRLQQRLVASRAQQSGESAETDKLPPGNTGGPAPDDLNILRALQLKQPMSREQYDAELPAAKRRLALAARHEHFRNTGAVVVFEGNDAAGKGGAIRRLVTALDPRIYRIVPIASPTDAELARPYLWRFWLHVPAPGRLTLFDRSWYGRVLVERVEGFAARADWQRAYAEINDFEAQLAERGIVVVKFWLAISKTEQEKRFRQRESTPLKQHKITAEDWRNREKWDAYEAAVCDMVERTSTDVAPWTLVEADNKRFARIKVINTLAKAIEPGITLEAESDSAAFSGAQRE